MAPMRPGKMQRSSSRGNNRVRNFRLSKFIQNAVTNALQSQTTYSQKNNMDISTSSTIRPIENPSQRSNTFVTYESTNEKQCQANVFSGNLESNENVMFAEQSCDSYRCDEENESNKYRILYSDSEDDEFDNIDCEDEYDDDKIHADIMNSVKKENLTDQDLKEKLIPWSRTIAKSKLTELLKILHPFHPKLPLSAKTLLKTDLNLKHLITPFNGRADCQFAYFGIAPFLHKYINVKFHPDDTLYLQINVDGLPLFRSSLKEFWPILGRVYTPENLYKPFTIAVHFGIGKPSSLEEYLSKFVSELNGLLANGIMIQHKKMNVRLMCFACDKPARSFIKCIKSHTGFYACERCAVKGEHYNNRMVYIAKDEAKRTDESFREKIDGNHRLDNSPLLRIDDLDMISHFVLEFMHLGHLGLTKKMIDYWLGTGTTKLTKEQICMVSQRLVNMSSQIPSEFQRTTRSLAEISKWKAIELKLFSTYSGPFVMKGHLPEDLRQHFLLLYVSYRIFQSPELCLKYNPKAKEFSMQFAKEAETKYGLESQIFNMHSFTHVDEDVENMQVNVNEFTAFPFENKLGEIKKYLKSGNKPLEQLCTMIEQELCFDETNIEIPKQIEVLKCSATKEETVIDIQRLKYKNFLLTTKQPNNVIMLNDGSIIRIKKIQSIRSQIQLSGDKFNSMKSAFDSPIDSKLLKIFLLDCKDISESGDFLLSQIECKMVFLQIFELELDEKITYVMPLLHTT